jgi:hypothetical protein
MGWIASRRFCTGGTPDWVGCAFRLIVSAWGPHDRVRASISTVQRCAVLLRLDGLEHSVSFFSLSLELGHDGLEQAMSFVSIATAVIRDNLRTTNAPTARGQRGRGRGGQGRGAAPAPGAPRGPASAGPGPPAGRTPQDGLIPRGRPPALGWGGSAAAAAAAAATIARLLRATSPAVAVRRFEEALRCLGPRTGPCAAGLPHRGQPLRLRESLHSRARAGCLGCGPGHLGARPLPPGPEMLVEGRRQLIDHGVKAGVGERASARPVAVSVCRGSRRPAPAGRRVRGLESAGLAQHLWASALPGSYSRAASAWVMSAAW